MKLDKLYIVTGFAWVVVGMVFGAWLGASGNFQYSNTHAHANLLGFVIPVLFGLILRGWPELMADRLGEIQFGVYQLGTLLLVAGKFDIDSGGHGSLAPIGSVIIVLGVLLMAWMFIRDRSAGTVAEPAE